MMNLSNSYLLRNIIIFWYKQNSEIIFSYQLFHNCQVNNKILMYVDLKKHDDFQLHYVCMHECLYLYLESTFHIQDKHTH